MRVHMWNDLGTSTYCDIAGNWEGRTLQADKVTCQTCIENMPKPEPVKLYTMLLRERETGCEEVVYGHANENVMTQFGIPNLHSGRFGPGEWELVIRVYVDVENQHHCDYSNCAGHPHEHNYCSMQRREEGL